MGAGLIVLVLLAGFLPGGDKDCPPVRPHDSAVGEPATAVAESGTAIVLRAGGFCGCCVVHPPRGHKFMSWPNPYIDFHGIQNQNELPEPGYKQCYYYDLKPDIPGFLLTMASSSWPTPAVRLPEVEPKIVPLGHKPRLGSRKNWDVIHPDPGDFPLEAYDHYEWSQTGGVEWLEPVNGIENGTLWEINTPPDGDLVTFRSNGTQTAWVHFAQAGRATVKVRNTLIMNFNFGTPDCWMCGHPVRAVARPRLEETAEAEVGVTVVEVASVTAAGAKPVQVMVGEVEETHYYLKADATPGATALVTALPNPDDVAEADLEGIWTVTRTSTNGAAGKVVPRTTWAKVVDDQVVLQDSFKLFDVHLDTPATHTFLAKCGQSQKKLTLHIIQAKITTPHGDPTQSPDDQLPAGTEDALRANSTNEISYTPTFPGVAAVTCAAASTPLAGRLIWTIPVATTANASTLQPSYWSNNGEPEAMGRGASTIAYFNGLPQLHSDFGIKEIELKFDFDDDIKATTEFELFFPVTMDGTSYGVKAINHPGNINKPPGEITPNWFFYWEQLFPEHNLIYNEQTDYGEVPGITKRPTAALADLQQYKAEMQIYIGRYHPVRRQSYGVGTFYSGIDSFAATVHHEAKHVQQFVKFDPPVIANGHERGWSWMIKPCTHWDTEPSLCRRFTLTSNGVEVRADYCSDWPRSEPIPLPRRDPKLCNYMEEDAVNAAESAMGSADHKYWDKDWGFPGKQHGKNKDFTN